MFSTWSCITFSAKVTDKNAVNLKGKKKVTGSFKFSEIAEELDRYCHGQAVKYHWYGVALDCHMVQNYLIPKFRGSTGIKKK